GTLRRSSPAPTACLTPPCSGSHLASPSSGRTGRPRSRKPLKQPLLVDLHHQCAVCSHPAWRQLDHSMPARAASAPCRSPDTWPDPGQRPLLSVLHRLPELAGTVVDETGGAVTGATLVLKQPGGPAEWSLTSGADGTFAFRGTLAPGTYLVEVNAPEHDSYLG